MVFDSSQLQPCSFILLWSPEQPSPAPALPALCFLSAQCPARPPGSSSISSLLLLSRQADGWHSPSFCQVLALTPSSAICYNFIVKFHIVQSHTLLGLVCCLKSPSVLGDVSPHDPLCHFGTVSPRPSQAVWHFLSHFCIIIFLTFPSMHCEKLSPARQELSKHQPVFCLLTFSVPLGTVIQLPAFALETHLCHYFLLSVLISWFLVWLLCLLLCSWGRDFCSNWGLLLAGLKLAGCVYKFGVFYNFSLNLDQMQCPVTFRSQSQPDPHTSLPSPSASLPWWDHGHIPGCPGLEYTPMCTHFLHGPIKNPSLSLDASSTLIC